MPEITTHPNDIAEPAPLPDQATECRQAPTLQDEYLQSACTLARGRTAWTPGPGHGTEDLPWLKGAAAA